MLSRTAKARLHGLCMPFSWSDVCAPGGNAAAQKVERIVSREDGQLSLIRGLDEASNPLDIG
jgi:hypothetical protein